MAPRILLAAALALAAGACPGQDEVRIEERMGAFQCLSCPEGGALTGILQRHGRGRREFGPFAQLCVSDYRYIDGQLYVRFKLEGRLWPDDGEFAVQASSWEAVCTTRP